MATNIYNPETKKYGYQVPGAEMPSGFAAIDSSMLAPSTSVVLPTTQPNTTSAGIIAATQPIADPLAQATKTVNNEFSGVNAIQNWRQKAVGYIGDLFKQESDIQTAQQNSEQQKQYDAENKSLTDINTEIANEQVKLRGAQDAIRGRGDISKEAQQGLLDNTNDTYGRRLADLAIRQSAANLNITKLKSDLKDALDAKLAPIEREIKYYQDFYLKNLDQLSADEKAKVSAIISEKKSIEDKITTQQNTFNAAINEALKNGVKIPDFVVQQMQKDPGNAYSILASNGISLQDPVDALYKRAQTAKLYADIAKMKDDNQVLSIKDAQTLGVPYGTTKAQAIASGKTPGVSEAASTLKTNALDSANALLQRLKNGQGTAAVGFSRVFGTQYVPGSDPRDFQVQLDNLKSLLSLDNVKLLKGQGQVSDAERILLERASGKLDPSQSETVFKSALEDIVKGLSGTPGLTPTTTTLVGPDGVQYNVPNDQVDAFIKAGGKRI